MSFLSPFSFYFSLRVCGHLGRIKKEGRFFLMNMRNVEDRMGIERDGRRGLIIRRTGLVRVRWGFWARVHWCCRWLLIVLLRMGHRFRLLDFKART